MTAEQREAILEGVAGPFGEEQARELGARADGYFDDDYPVSVLGFLQALMRERWRTGHGSCSRWDSVARTGGVFAIGRVILGR